MRQIERLRRSRTRRRSHLGGAKPVQVRLPIITRPAVKKIAARIEHERPRIVAGRVHDQVRRIEHQPAAAIRQEIEARDFVERGETTRVVAEMEHPTRKRRVVVARNGAEQVNGQIRKQRADHASAVFAKEDGPAFPPHE